MERSTRSGRDALKFRRLKIRSGVHVPAAIRSDLPTAQHREEFCEGCKVNRCGGDKKEKANGCYISKGDPGRRGAQVEKHERIEHVHAEKVGQVGAVRVAKERQIYTC